jgi:hypothetical protein
MGLKQAFDKAMDFMLDRNIGGTVKNSFNADGTPQTWRYGSSIPVDTRIDLKMPNGQPEKHNLFEVTTFFAGQEGITLSRELFKQGIEKLLENEAEYKLAKFGRLQKINRTRPRTNKFTPKGPSLISAESMAGLTASTPSTPEVEW